MSYTMSCKGYYVDTVGRNKKVIEEYIKNQIQEDLAYEQLSLREYIDTFTGCPDYYDLAFKIEFYNKISALFMALIKSIFNSNFLF